MITLKFKRYSHPTFLAFLCRASPLGSHWKGLAASLDHQYPTLSELRHEHLHLHLHLD